MAYVVFRAILLGSTYKYSLVDFFFEDTLRIKSLSVPDIDDEINYPLMFTEVS